MKQTRALALLMAATMLLPSQALAAAPAGETASAEAISAVESRFTDFPSDWSSAALASAVENRLLEGNDGRINPQGLLTRAELAAVVVRAFGATEAAALTGYGDVDAGAWYADAMARAVQMGVLMGSDGNLYPERTITREETFTVLARVLGLADGDAAALEDFADGDQVSAWAAGAMAAMVEHGYVEGSGGNLNPQGTITRAELAQVMYTTVSCYIDDTGAPETLPAGNVVVRAAGADLTGLTIRGDLILADGVGLDAVALDGVTIEGRLVIRGGGEVLVRDTAVAGGVLVSNPNGTVLLEAEASDLGQVEARTGLTLAGDAEVLTVTGGGPVTVQSGTVDRLVLAAGAEGAAVTVAEGAEVTLVQADAAGVTITGDGAVGTVQANADDVAVRTPNTQVVAGENTSGVTAAGEPVGPGQTGTINASGTGATVSGTGTGTSSGSHSGSGSSSSSVTVHRVGTWQELKAAALAAEDGDVIRLTQDITDAGSDTGVVDGVSGATLPLNKDITLDGSGHTITAAADKTFCFDVDGAGEGNAITVEDLTVDGASFSAKMGGAFFVEDGAAATFRNVTVRNANAASASATNGGGAIFVNDHGNPPTVTIEDCVFADNFVGEDGGTGRGGAIYVNNFRAGDPVRVTIRGSAFRNNRAAYGGAIAADGVVELTVEDCSFENNAAAVGADDIYLFEGESQGKKSMTITSQVAAALTGNDYTNDGGSAQDMTAMNVVYGRYYPAGFSGVTGTAPADAVDLTFTDTERTTLAQPAESLAMTALTVGGRSYYYGVAAYQDGGWLTAFTVDGQAVEAARIGETNVYYYTAEPLEGKVYGTATLSYAEFYAGSVTSTEGLDAVSSATTGKNTMFTYEDSTEPVEGEGYQILGLHSVPVQVDGTQYAQAEILEAAGALSGQSAYEAAAEIALNADPTAAPAWYKPLGSDGSYGALVVSDPVEVTDATAELSTSSNWGDYQVAVTETSTSNLRNDRNSGWPVGENIMGILVEAEQDGETVVVGLRHLENIWVQTYEFAFDAAGQTAALEGATIRRVSYLVPENVYVYTFEGGIYVKPQYEGAVTLEASFSSGQRSVTVRGIPADLADVRVNVYLSAGHGQRTMLVTDAVPDATGTVALDAGAEAAPDTTYTVQISSSNYADLTATVDSGKSLADWAAYEDGFETFLNYMDDPALQDAWERAAAAMSAGGTAYTAESLKAMWTALCATTTQGQDTPIEAMEVEDQTVTFLDETGQIIGSYAYAWVETVAQGLEGAETFVFRTDDPDAGAFTYLAMMAPGYDEGMAAHFHFRYGATQAALDLSNLSNMWYPTMLDASATTEEKAQVILAMHGVEDEPSGNVTVTGQAAVSFGYTAQVRVTYDPATGRIVSVSDNGTEPGSNQSFWTSATALFANLVGLTREEVAEVDVVSGATVSSNAIKQAVQSALAQVPGAAPAAPTLQTADRRTQPLYAATGPAELTVSWDGDSQIWYTTDGADPAPGEGSARQLEGSVLSVTPTANIDHTVTVKAVAVRDGQTSSAAQMAVEFAAIPVEETGLRVYEGSATCPGNIGYPYQVLVRVTTLNGVIQRIEDNGTVPVDIRDEAYWNNVYRGDASGMDISEKLSGMTLADLLAARTTPNDGDYSTDAVSGATISSDAVKYAAVDALRSQPVESSDDAVMAPVVTPTWDYTVTSVTSWASIYLDVEAAAGTTVRYTTDGTDPTGESAALPSYSRQIRIACDQTSHPEGQAVEVKCAAFDEAGQRSRVVTTWVVFAVPRTGMPYETGTYTAAAGGVTASVEIVNDYGDAPILQTVTLDAQTQARCADFLPALLARVYLAQSTQVELLADWDAAAQQAVLDAVAAALDQAVRAPAPQYTVTPELERYTGYYGTYAFEEPPAVAFSSAVPGAEIYYLVSTTYAGSTPSLETWTRYEGPITPEFTALAGGSVYLCAAVTLDGGATWSESSRVTIAYGARASEDAFEVDGQSFSTFASAAAAVEEGGTIFLNEDIESSMAW